MVAAPVSYSGNQPGNNLDMSKSQTQMYATPNAPISILLPYGGQSSSLYPTQSPNIPPTGYPPVSAPPPPQYNPYPPPSSPYAAYPPNSSQLTNTYPPNQPQAYQFGQPQSGYPPTTYPPHPNNHQAYPQAGHSSGTYPPAPTSTYPQSNNGNHGMGTYPPMPTAQGGIYPPPPTGGVYPPPPRY